MLTQWKKSMLVGAAALTLTGGMAVAGLSLSSTPASAAPVTTGPAAVAGHRGGPGGDLGDWGRHGEALAAELGIPVAELQAAHESVRAQLAEQTGDVASDRVGRRGMRVEPEVMQEMLAGALGISVEEFAGAVEAVHAAALAEALANGEITQEQIDWMEAAQAVRRYIDHEALLAGVLGLTVDELEALKGDRAGLRDLLEEMGLDREALRGALLTAHADALTDAVDAGVITREQADLLRDGEGLGGRGFGTHGGHGVDGRRARENSIR